MTLIRLGNATTEALIEVGAGPPTIAHWGRPSASGADLSGPDVALQRPIVHGAPDIVAPVAIVPEHGSGFPGRPGLLGHRPDGTDWAPRFVASSHTLDGTELVVETVDPVAQLALIVRFDLQAALVLTAEIANTHSTLPYHLDGLSITVPVPETVGEIGTFTGRWTREFHPVRVPWPHGTYSVENRRGRTSHEAPPLIFAGTKGFDEWNGSVWGAHIAWSGNHSILAERLPDGRRYLQLGELLHSGEITLAPGESYRTPEIIAVHSDSGLTAATQQYHRHLRQRPSHPSTPRPVLLNTWEATYFNHDFDTLCSLATSAAAIGVERFVLDDGWFGSRRDDTSGLGDWVVSPEAHPNGLTPLIDHVTGLGMEFGLWVEPEMVNPDSNVYRAHPDWAMVTDGYEPVLARNQLVLDLTNPLAFDHVLSQLDALLRDHNISFLKWDMNRDHIGASDSTGKAGTHGQTLALYRLLDELLRRHPTIEIESCSSGGARIDHEILRRTTRVWTSDCNDALERQTIQRGASMLIPPELMGSHIGPPKSHTTGRIHSLAFRAATALFGQLGIEWNLLSLNPDRLEALSTVIALHKQLRPLLHHGDVVRYDTESSYVAHGVYATDRSQAIVSFACTATALSLTPPPLLLPDLDPDITYRVEVLRLSERPMGANRTGPAWLEESISLSGRQLAAFGIQLPALHPESAVIIRLSAI